MVIAAVEKDMGDEMCREVSIELAAYIIKVLQKHLHKSTRQKRYSLKSSMLKHWN